MSDRIKTGYGAKSGTATRGNSEKNIIVTSKPAGIIWPHWLLWLSTLLGMGWPMTHSVGLRNTLLACLLAACVFLYRRHAVGRLLPASLGIPTKLYLLLSAWLLVTVLFADDPLDSLSEYRRDWVMGFVALMIGMMMARLASINCLPGLSRITLLGSVGLGLALPAVIPTKAPFRSPSRASFATRARSAPALSSPSVIPRNVTASA